ncbi:hypothetical protein [Mangrovibacterium lignilyticum]|uniref:hypothetical protein n=1 Tax=Mangrovibacterium lignilyticum TaxID=2668052 RepID=UPI0013D4E3C6|nr:hypothetical protein [Mangrovibacterium lignilyticum]
MSFSADLYNQEFIDKYFKGWIGISVDIPAKPAIEPMLLNLEFDSKCNASGSLVFLHRWQTFSAEKKLRLNLIEEPDGQLSCYFFTPGYPCFKLGRFKSHVNWDKIRRFAELQKEYSAYQVVTRYADQNYDVQEAESQNIIVFLDNLAFRKREKVGQSELEFE